jgi:hypothetical protein
MDGGVMKYYYRIHCIHTNRPLCSKVFTTEMAAHEYAEKVNIQVALNRSRMNSDEGVIVRY